VDIFTSTLGKTLGGAVGGFTCGRAEVVEFLRQRSRPYLFSNTLRDGRQRRPEGARSRRNSPQLRDRLRANARQLRAALEGAGFQLKPGEHPIMPVMLGDAALAGRMADQLLQHGIYVIAFSYRWCRRGRPASAFRCRRRTLPNNWTGGASLHRGRQRAWRHLTCADELAVRVHSAGAGQCHGLGPWMVTLASTAGVCHMVNAGACPVDRYAGGSPAFEREPPRGKPVASPRRMLALA